MNGQALKTPLLPPVSIYIITYLNTEERGHILKRCCEHALAQSYPDFEVVVADNGGTFSAKDVLSPIADPRLRVVRNSANLGFTGNINQCVDYCSHEIIKPLCDDDFIHPDCLMVLVPHVDQETMVVVDYEKFDIRKEPEWLDHPLPEEIPVETRLAGYGRDLWDTSYVACPSATMFTKSLFSGLGGYHAESLVSDWDFLIRAALKGVLCHIQLPLCYMGEWEESLTEKINADLPYYFPAAGLFTKFSILRKGQISFWNRIALRFGIFIEVLLQFLRLLRHMNQQDYRSGFVKFMSEYITCSLGRKRSQWNHADPAFGDE